MGGAGGGELGGGLGWCAGVGARVVCWGWCAGAACVVGLELCWDGVLGELWKLALWAWELCGLVAGVG